MFLLVTVVGLLFSVFAFTRTLLRFRDGKISRGMFLFWSIVWVSVVLFLIFPDSFEKISKAFGINRPLDFALVFSTLLLYYLIFRIYVMMEDIRRDVSLVVRNIAIKEDEKRASKKKDR